MRNPEWDKVGATYASARAADLWIKDGIAVAYPKPTHRFWTSFACIVKAVPPGARFVSITLKGRAVQYQHAEEGFGTSAVIFADPLLSWNVRSHPEHHHFSAQDFLKGCHHSIYEATTFSEKVWH